MLVHLSLKQDVIRQIQFQVFKQDGINQNYLKMSHWFIMLASYF